MKKMLALLLTLCLLAGLVPLGAGAEETEDGTGPWMVEFDAGARYYSTFEDALEAVKGQEKYPGSVDTIFLTKDTTESITIDKDESAVVNIEGKVTLTNKEGQHTITVNQDGSLLIEGRGTVDNVSHGKGAVYNSGYVELRGNVTFDRSKENGSNDSTNGGNSWYTICNHGEMKISGNATVTTAGGGENLSTKGRYSSLVENGYYKWNSGDESSGYVEGINNKYPSLTIEGGNFSGGLNTIKNDDHGVVVINNGNFGNYYHCVVMNHHKATVTGGTFTAAEGSNITTYGIYNCACVSEHDIGELEISGGTFSGANFAVADVSSVGGKISISKGFFSGTQGAIGVTNDHTGVITISGGTFSSNVSQYTEEGYTAVQKDGQYVVEKLDATNAVASVGENYFKSVADAVEEAAKNNGTVILLRDAMFDTLSLSTGSVTVDLSGYRLTSDSGKTSDITNSSKLIIQDSRGTGKLVYNGFQDPAQAAFEIQAGSSITLNGTHYETSGTAVFAWGNATIVNVQDTVIDSKGYCVGTNAAQTANYQVDINIVNSQLTSALDGAGTAVLFNVPGTLDIENSTLNGHWQGIIARGGTITVRDSVITNTYDTLNNSYEDKWGTGNAVTVAGIAIGNKGNNDYNYPVSVTLENTSVTSVGPNPAIYVYQMEGKMRTVTVKISGDSAVSGDFIVKKDEKVEKVDVSISGGYFTSDPSEYCDDGLTGLPGQYVVDGATYQYMVGEKLDEDVKVATGETEAKKATDVNMGEDDVKKIGETKADGLTLKANETAAGLSPEDKATKEKYDAAADTLSDQIPDAASENITTVIAPRLEIEITGYDGGTAAATEKSLTLNIEAVYDIKATTATGGTPMVEYDAETSNASKVNTVTIKKNAGTLDTTGQDVVISIPLPDGFITETEGGTLPTVYVQHKNIYEYKAEVTSDGKPSPTYTATFTNPHGFSTFVFSTETKAVATVDDTDYTNFQQAVNAASPNGTIEVKADDLSATGVTHSLTLKNGDNTQPITVTINGKTITIPAGGTETFTYTAPTPPRPTEEKHSITISTDGKGQVTGPASAAEDDKVTLTVKPNADKELYDLKVTDEDGKAIAVTKVNDTTYTFTMPDGKVTVAATFGCDGGDNCPSKAFTDLGDKQWYHDSIDYAVENGLLEGTSPTTMEPNATLIRAQLAQILYNIEDKPAVTGEMIFEDVPASEWFYSPVLWANQNKIINGTSPTTFEPLEDISRQDLALMLYRYAGKPAVTGDLDGFTDADQVGDWAEEAMTWAVAEGIVQGDTPTTLNPTGTATRAEAAAMLQRFLEDAA